MLYPRLMLVAISVNAATVCSSFLGKYDAPPTISASRRRTPGSLRSPVPGELSDHGVVQRGFSARPEAGQHAVGHRTTRRERKPRRQREADAFVEWHDEH